MRVRTVIVVVVAAVIGGLLAVPAGAKGADAVTIDGVGLRSPIAVTGREGDGGALMDLADGLGFYAAVFREQPDPMLKAPPTNDLGPVLDVSWRLPTGPSSAVTVRQHLYPDAASGPLVYTEPGQPTFATTTTYGGWYQAQPAVRALLTRLGVPSREALSAAAGPPTEPSPPAARAGSPLALPLVATATAAVLLALLVTIATGRRRARIAPA